MKKTLKMLPKTNIALPLTNNTSATQNKLQCTSGVAMQDNVAQHWW